MNKTATVVLSALLLFAASSCVIETYPDRPVSRPPVPPPPPPLPVGYDVGLFYDDLAPYGDWLWLAPYGWVFSPSQVGPGWRPYSAGRWLYTDDGWLFDSDDPWGWASYHYGRWFYEPRHGWCWVPGTEWAPSWVVFRSGGGWLGWAPMPPGITVRAGIGIDYGGVNIDVVIQPFMWLFVPEREVFDPRIGVRIVPAPRNVTIVKETRPVANYVVVHDRVVNRGVEIERVERTLGRPAPRYRVVDSDVRGKPVLTREQEVRVFRRTLKPAPAERHPARGWVVEDEHGRPATKPTPPVPAPPVTRPAVPAPPPPAAPLVESLRKREEAERTELEKRLASEREELRRAHERETRQPPAGADAERLQKSHEAEKRAFDDEARRQRSLLESRQKEREKRQAERPAPQKGKEKKDEKKSGKQQGAKTP